MQTSGRKQQNPLSSGGERGTVMVTLQELPQGTGRLWLPLKNATDEPPPCAIPPPYQPPAAGPKPNEPDPHAIRANVVHIGIETTSLTRRLRECTTELADDQIVGPLRRLRDQINDSLVSAAAATTLGFVADLAWPEEESILDDRLDAWPEDQRSIFLHECSRWVAERLEALGEKDEPA
jgi:hypothetical protein